MQVFLHRANTEPLLKRARNLGIGVEVDIRTSDCIPYLSHDPMYCWDGEIDDMSLESALLHEIDLDVPFLLDFKEVGIVDIVKDVCPHIPDILRNALCIDLFVPDMYYAQSVGLKTLVRHSQYESIRHYRDEKCKEFDAGRWFDFKEDWYDFGYYGKRFPTYLVSPELHGWELTDDFIVGAIRNEVTGVCTDFPERWLEAINGYNNSNP